jgi:hypothetical protein
VRCAKNSVTTTVSSSSSSSPSFVIATERGCASEGRAFVALTESPKKPVPASTGFRSIVSTIASEAASTTWTVPSTQLVT